MMSDKEFSGHFDVIHKLHHDSNLGYGNKQWVQFILNNLHLIPKECVEMMSLDMPLSCAWSEEVIEGAKHYLENLEIEDILLIGEK